MKKQFKIIPLCALLVLLTGCVNAGVLSIGIPTRKPTVATEEFLGHLYPTNYVNGMYHSLADTQYKKALVPLRWAELQGIKIVAQGELEFQEKEGSLYEKLAMGAFVAVAGFAGWQIPRPQEKGKVVEALHANPPNATG